MSKAWFYKFMGCPYAEGPMRFAAAVTETAARTHLRELLGVKTLRGIEIWPTSQ
jgi:hypothetical protein